MAFDKDYPNRKDWRKPYREHSHAAVSTGGRPHGGCPRCLGARTHKHARQAPADQILSVAEYEAWRAQDTAEIWATMDTDSAFSLMIKEAYDRRTHDPLDQRER